MYEDYANPSSHRIIAALDRADSATANCIWFLETFRAGTTERTTAPYGQSVDAGAVGSVRARTYKARSKLNCNTWVQGVAMGSYKHLTAAERTTLMVMRAEGASQIAVAEHLGRDKSTISRELARNLAGPAAPYDAVPNEFGFGTASGLSATGVNWLRSRSPCARERSRRVGDAVGPYCCRRRNTQSPRG